MCAIDVSIYSFGHLLKPSTVWVSLEFINFIGTGYNNNEIQILQIMKSYLIQLRENIANTTYS